MVVNNSGFPRGTKRVVRTCKIEHYEDRYPRDGRTSEQRPASYDTGSEQNQGRRRRSVHHRHYRRRTPSHTHTHTHTHTRNSL